MTMNAMTPMGRPFGVAAPAGSGAPSQVVSLGASLMRTIELWLRRARYRDELERLSDHQLRDIGLDRETVLHEAGKPFWRA
jgi:uncharacterized protein YjiS (DUF1127 family)